MHDAAAPPMPAKTAEWIREHAWTGKMRETFREVPGFYLSCACQYGLTTSCRTGKHGTCHRATPLPDNETEILGVADRQLHFKKPFQHMVHTSATGPHCSRQALVWLADRICRWVCPCGCHRSQIPGRAPAAVGETLDLFGGAA